LSICCLSEALIKPHQAQDAYYIENDKTTLFPPRQHSPPFLSIPSVVFTSRLLVALKIAGLLMMRMQTWRWTSLLQMLEVTTTGSHSHVGSQVLGEVRHCLVNVFLWQLFPDGVQGSFQASVVLCFSWNSLYFSSITHQT